MRVYYFKEQHPSHNMFCACSHYYRLRFRQKLANFFFAWPRTPFFLQLVHYYPSILVSSLIYVTIEQLRFQENIPSNQWYIARIFKYDDRRLIMMKLAG